MTSNKSRNHRDPEEPQVLLIGLWTPEEENDNNDTMDNPNISRDRTAGTNVGGRAAFIGVRVLVRSAQSPRPPHTHAKLPDYIGQVFECKARICAFAFLDIPYPIT